MNAPDPIAAVASLRAKLWDAGFRPVALLTGDKKTLIRDWSARARRDPPADAVEPPRRDMLNTGLLCDGLRVVDIDVDDPELAGRVRALALSMLGPDAPIRTRAHSPRSALLYRAAEGEPVKRTLVGSDGKVEVLGRGQQLHAFGRHPDGADLQWYPDAPGWVTRDSLPAVTEAQVNAFLAAVAPIIGAVPPGAEWSAGKSDRSGDDRTIDELLDAIVAGRDYHGAMLRLGGILAARGQSLAAAEALVKAAMRRTPEPERDARWQVRFDDIYRTLGYAWAKQASEDQKRPLFRELPPAPPFPIAALGVLGPAAEAIHLVTQAPIAICAQSVLAASTLAVQPHYDVELPGAGRRPLTGLFLTVAESGERKTSVDRHANRPVVNTEQRWAARSDEARKFHMHDHEAWKATREAAKKTHKGGDRASLARALEAIGPEPKPPPPAMVLVADPTPEALVMHLAEGRPWAGLFTSEGGLLFGGVAFSDESRLRTGALLNTLWDGEPIRRRRVTTGMLFLPGRRVSTHIMVQPIAAQRLLGDAELDGIGLLARFLIVAPESTAGSRLFREPTSVARQALDEYAGRLTALLDREARRSVDVPEALDPVPLALHPDASKMWIAFHDVVEADQKNEGELRAIRPFASKMAEHAGRLAAVLTVYADAEAREVSAEAMANGIQLAQHYAAELLRLRGAATVAPDLALADRLLRWWQARENPRCHLAEIYQRGLNAIGDASTARRIVGVLHEHGWVSRLPAGTELAGRPRREAWELVP